MKELVLLITLATLAAQLEPGPVAYFMDPVLIKQTYAQLSAGSDLSKDLRIRLTSALRATTCVKDSYVVVILDPDIAQELTRQLRTSSPIEQSVRDKLIVATDQALRRIAS